MNAVLDNGKENALAETARRREGVVLSTERERCGLLLLMVEDDQNVCDVVSFRLHQRGFLVSFAHSGEQALELVGKTHFDLVLLDIGLPGITGIEVLKTLRQRYSSAEMPIIMLSGKASSEEIVEALDLGANDFIVKPIDFSVALARVRTQVSRIQVERALHESEERFALAARAANDGLWDWNLITNVTYYSPRWKSVLGYEESEIGNVPEEWFNRIHPEDIARVKADISAHLSGQTPQYENEHRMLHKNGTYRWILSRGMMICEVGGRVSRIAGSLTDITEAKVADALTGLPNRILFLDRLGRTFERAKYVDGYRYAVLFLDLDRFKGINDSLGHLMGDQLIFETARRLKGCLHTADTVARLGGDEFTILLEDIKQLDDATKVADRIKKELSAPFILGGQEVFVTASLGIALSDRSYERPEDLLRDADIAMYRAKALGKARWELFDAEMRTQAVARVQFENDLRRALLRREFQVYYQPIVLLETGRICGFEALVRWLHPSRGLISPAEFVPVAEETGLIIPICRWVLYEACLQTKLWQGKYPANPPLIICVNLSSKQFMQEDLVKHIRQTLDETGLSASSLKLELSEGLIAESERSSNNVFKELGDHGIRVVIDDFGTCSSSLSSLQRYPIESLKINRTFINAGERDGLNSVLIRTIVGLAHNLGFSIVAVGVEKNEQLAQLKELGCEFGQGYYFSSPVDANAVIDLMARQSQS